MTAETETNGIGLRLGDMLIVLRDAAIATLISALVAVVVNLVHPEAIPFVAEEEYEILVPCPEPGGKVTPIEASDPTIAGQDSFFVDARSKEEFEAFLKTLLDLEYPKTK